MNNELPKEEVEVTMAEAPEEKPKPTPETIPKYTAPTILGGFSEDFLSRVNINDKINNILRSPTKAPKCVRQRSVFTTINTSARNMPSVVMTPHLQQGQLGPQGLQGPTRSIVPPAMYPISDGIPKECATPSSMPARHIGLSMPTGPSPHRGYGPSYEAPMGPHNGVPPRPGNYSAHPRYPVPASPAVHRGYNNYDGNLPQQTANMFNARGSHPNQQFPVAMPPPPYAFGRVQNNSHRRPIEHENPTPPPCPGAGPIAMGNGTIQIRLRDGVRIDMTLDKAVRVLNQRSMVSIALSRNCSNSAMIHPNGRILQSGSKVEIITYDGMKTNNFVRYAKMWYKGVSFTSENCALIYLVDTAGTRTTTDTFTDLSKDYTLTVFYDDSRHGPSFFNEAQEMVTSSTYHCSDDGTETYEINGFRIVQAADGLVKLTRLHNKCLIRTSPSNGSATLTTPSIHCTASLGKTSHLFVRRNEKRMHFDGSCFIVRNAGHSAGFNENNLLIVY